jgi:2-dehydropantoate 2-reductase
VTGTLVFGAGVLGSLYAARIHEAGYEVTILARGQRLRQIREHGILLQHALNGRQADVMVPVVDRLGADDAYDLIIVLVRDDQLDSTFESLARNRATGRLLFMVNNPAGSARIARAVGAERLLLGFPGAAGYRTGETIHYLVLPRWFQPTTLGEPDGRKTERLAETREILRRSGFPVSLCQDMDAWYKYHAAWVAPVAYAIYAASGSDGHLARQPELIRLMLRSIKEGWNSLRVLGLPLTPGTLRLLEIIPEAILVPLIARVMNTRFADAAAYRHSQAAPAEMTLLARDLREVMAPAGQATPSWDALYAAGEKALRGEQGSPRPADGR